ncbi:MAG: signal peptidase I [Gemmatimonadota bacterium]|nr:signal peptidase I [Gemmatimonadota bacterium]
MTAPSGSRLGRAVAFLKSLAVPVLIFLLLRTFVIEAFHIWPSGSMERTLLIGDFLFVNKMLYGAELPVVHTRLPAIRAPLVGDVVIFNSVEEPGLTVVKRIVGLPGDTLAMEGDVLFRNGAAVAEPYAQHLYPDLDPTHPDMRRWQLPYYLGADPARYRPSLKRWGPLVVPPDSFFVMGDNRDDSYDSRYWGFLGRDRIRGTPMLVYYSYDHNGPLPLPFLTAIRWDRILSVPE